MQEVLNKLDLQIVRTISKYKETKKDLNNALSNVADTLELTKDMLEVGKIPTIYQTTQGNEWRIYVNQSKLALHYTHYQELKELRETLLENNPELKSEIIEADLTVDPT